LISRVARWNAVMVMVLALLTFASMAKAANMGGDIRHPEILSAEESAAAEGAQPEPSEPWARL
jgi:hypothetical protein